MQVPSRTQPRTPNFRSNNPVDYEGSAKLKVIRHLLSKWKPLGHKVLIFSQTRMMLDVVENAIEQLGHRYIRMDGSTSAKHRIMLLDKFNTDPSVFVALLTTKAGGLGVNLTGADRVLILDPDWNPEFGEVHPLPRRQDTTQPGPANPKTIHVIHPHTLTRHPREDS